MEEKLFERAYGRSARKFFLKKVVLKMLKNLQTIIIKETFGLVLRKLDYTFCV